MKPINAPQPEPVLDDLAALAGQFREGDAAVGLQAGSLDALVQDGLGDGAALEALPAKAPVQDRLQDPAEQLLDALHQDYLRTLQDPQHLGSGGAWSLQGDDLQNPLIDEFERLKASAPASQSLYELLGPPPPIDQLMQSLDIGTAVNDVLAPEPLDSVLHLLAPEHLRTPPSQAQDLLSALEPEALPGLTRKEHHDMALDSAIASLLGSPSGTPTP
ncbi:TagK domain-containing protein [Roseateles sp. BYS180W]|uniref:TagK domain-containing protein n=1 Tax=Roseateles rivi TaxID=3299028 RepID=A0ABW7FSX3_9BURK